MNGLDVNDDELFKKYMPGLLRLSKELGLDIQTTMMLVSLHYQAKHCQELDKMLEDRKRLETAFEEYKNRVEAYKNKAEAWV